MRKAVVVVSLVVSLSCGNDHPAQKPPDLPVGTPTPDTFFTAQLTDKTFFVADHFLASVEMQISGEPFAQLLGRKLAGYDRFNKTTDLYLDPDTGVTVVDPLSYSMAVESYEYSKQPMNNTSFESGAGLAMQFGPLLNPDQKTGADAFVLLRDRVQQYAIESSSGGAPGQNYVISPAPTNNPLNVYGWPGMWPIFAEFQKFDPSIEPSSGDVRMCSERGGYASSAVGTQIVGDYECGSNTLNLPHREAQVTKLIEPDALGFAMWKQGLWVINYWQSLHDLAGNPITVVADADLGNVGKPNNTVVGKYPDPNDPSGNTLIDGVPGLYLGDIPLEGFQGLNMLDEMHNKSAFMLTGLTTTDGTTLSGFASTKAALDYDYTSPLRWWPSSVAVTETGTDDPVRGLSWQFFPQPTAFTIMSGSSRLHGLTAVLGGYAEMFALTDADNGDVGGQASTRATFDGDPFPGDNGVADGEDSPHDRALANLKVALVNVDRLHFDAKNAVLVDESTVVGGAAKLGTTVSAVSGSYIIVALRTALRSITSALTLYSNDTPDTANAVTKLDSVPFNGAPAPLGARARALITAQADFLVAKLIGSDGAVANSFDVSTGTADASPTRLESEAAVIRGLLDAYLATSNVKYRDAAVKVYGDLDKRFWMSDVRAYRTTAGVDDPLTYTPIVHAALQGALRQYWKLVASRPGSEQLGAELLERVQRENKLVLNGWDDANGDNLVQYPKECTGAGLQMGERALTGELGHAEDGPDRDHDCVKEVSVAKLPSALGGQLVLTKRK
jgi:hypothetical protein